MEKVTRKEMLKWTAEQLNEWREKAYADREHSYLECRYCGQYLPCTEYCRDSSASNRIGFRPECKECGKKVTAYGGIKKMKEMGVTIEEVIGDALKPVEVEPFKVNLDDVKLGDKVIVCKECGNEFIFTRGEQIYYRNHRYFNPSKCPVCREKTKIEKAKDEGLIDNVKEANYRFDNFIKTGEDFKSVIDEQPKSNSILVAEQAKVLLSELKANHLTLEAFERILNIYKDSNNYVLDLVKTFEDLIVGENI